MKINYQEQSHKIFYELCKKLNLYAGKSTPQELKLQWLSQDQIIYTISETPTFDFFRTKKNSESITPIPLKEIEQIKYGPDKQDLPYILIEGDIEHKLFLYQLKELIAIDIPMSELSNIVCFDATRPYTDNHSIIYSYIRKNRTKEDTEAFNFIISKYPLKLSVYDLPRIIEATIENNTQNQIQDIQTITETINNFCDYHPKFFANFKNSTNFIHALKYQNLDPKFFIEKFEKKNSHQSTEIFVKPNITYEHIYLDALNLMKKYPMPVSNSSALISEIDYKNHLQYITTFLNKPKNREAIGFSHLLLQDFSDISKSAKPNYAKLFNITAVRPTREIAPIISNIISKYFHCLSNINSTMTKEEIENTTQFDYKDMLKEKLPSIISLSLLENETKDIISDKKTKQYKTNKI